MSDVPSLLYTDVEDDLRAAVRSMLESHSPWARVLERTDGDVAGDRKLWTLLTDDLGLAGLALGEDVGGAGASWREVAVVLEELGRAVSDVPYLTSAVTATALAEALGARELLAELATGAVAAVAVPFTQPLDHPVSDPPRFAVGRIRGHVPAVAGAAEADVLLVPVAGAVVRVAAADVRIEPVPALDMTRRVADLDFGDGVAATMLAEGDAVPAALARAAAVSAALLASEQLGLAQRCLEMTVEYVGQRRQFGRLIGSYQALKHRLADLWTAIAQARAVARYAAACAAVDDEDLPVAASLAQAVCSAVAQQAAEECVQLHGGIGFTWEHPAHLYLKRARADALAHGTAGWHRRRVGALVDLPPVAD
ncbi:acyl-CoA/acyl-ACP dehydrogenase [Frankia sp. AiPs1]|uniref:acyl-CoA dehydrogenase family protein n=1 Tax=Frankia sp. AiPs1 TaxID=573493 RepID=UPI002044AD86|nr:acyl-CoA dehydrogenase family protein [Frankia sp. AiPs1]MCM3921788.1 acyl-CoA/acyl-ACP dehydrogenase [Frankia sp. AiPs1]